MRTAMKCAGIGLMAVGVCWATPKLISGLFAGGEATLLMSCFFVSLFAVAWILTMIPETYRRHGPGNRRLSD